MKKFLKDGLKGLIYFYFSIVVISSIFYLIGVNLNIDTKDSIGINLLSIGISKDTMNISIKPLASLIVFFISSLISIFTSKTTT